MRGHAANLRVVLLALGLLVAVGGCESLSVTEWWPYGRTEPDPKALARFGPTPLMRAEIIRHMADNARNRPPDEQQQIVIQLAQQIRMEPDPLLRTAILQTIAAYPSPLTDRVLQAGLRDDSREVRVACCGAWGRRGGAEAVGALGGVIAKDADIDVRLSAASALGQLREPGVVQALSVALEEKQDPALQYRAVQSLRLVTGRDFNNDLPAWRQFVQQGASAPVPASEGPSLAQRLFWWR